MNNKLAENYVYLAQQTGLQYDYESGTIFGERDGYTVILGASNYNLPYMLTLTVTASSMYASIGPGELKNFVKANKAVFKRSQKSGNSFLLTVKQSKNMQILGGYINQAISATTHFLSSNGYVNCCARCGAQIQTNSCYAGGVTMPLCCGCLENLKQTTSVEELKKLNKKENIAGGILGALVGSIIGGLCILLIAQLGYVAAISGIVMAAATLYGYEKLGGKLTKKGVIISAVLMIIMTLLANRTDWAIEVAKVAHTDFFTAFKGLSYLLQNGYIENTAYYWSIGMIFIFELLGGIPFTISMLKKRKCSGRIYAMGNIPENCSAEGTATAVYSEAPAENQESAEIK